MIYENTKGFFVDGSSCMEGCCVCQTFYRKYSNNNRGFFYGMLTIGAILIEIHSLIKITRFL